MKKILLFYLVFSIGKGLQAQSVRLYHEGSDVTNKTIKVMVDTLESEAFLEIQVMNTTGSSKDIKVKRILMNEIGGSENYICFAGNCYPPFVEESDIQQIDGVKVDSGFSSHYVHYNNCGTTKILFVFFNAANVNDSAAVTVDYEACAPAGINEPTSLFYKVYPNPASTAVFVELNDISVKSSVKLYDVTGALIRNVAVVPSGNVLCIETADMPSGIYFVQLSNGEQTAFRRITVSH